jgi:nicotinate-nucleotide adenylyltransferase
MDRSAARIGIFGGTFNPVHYGHLRAAEEVREAFGLDKVYLVPSARPPHKGASGLAAAAHRLNMVRKAVRGNPYLSGCAYECRKPGPSYSVETLAWFGRRHPGAELFFILGWDAWLEIGTWHACRELFSLANFIVISRSGHHPWLEAGSDELFPFALKDLFCYVDRSCYRAKSGSRLYFFTVSRIDVSASRIRRDAAAGRSLRYLVPASVIRYIDEYRLYS